MISSTPLEMCIVNPKVHNPQLVMLNFSMHPWTIKQMTQKGLLIKQSELSNSSNSCK